MKKSHLQMMQEIFNESGIDVDLEKHTKEVKTGVYTTLKMSRENGEDCGTIDWPETKIVSFVSLTVTDGYAGFYTLFTFDENDNLTSVEAFE